eukprot:TRINITY_DN37700_c0_g1_i3.p1 TRINITY_DN37700_c0_g1~~TRINITY_DN37700_c0_g1_i3.p1  ORF type:complete len:823 (+),score=238.90 TRINITY_DN37700_c0_g1_i3:76-2544(+)
MARHSGASRRAKGLLRARAYYAKVPPRVWLMWEKQPPPVRICTWDDPCGRCEHCRDRADGYFRRREAETALGAASVALVCAAAVETAALQPILGPAAAVPDAAAPRRGAVSGALAAVCCALPEMDSDIDTDWDAMSKGDEESEEPAETTPSAIVCPSAAVCPSAVVCPSAAVSVYAPALVRVPEREFTPESARPSEPPPAACAPAADLAPAASTPPGAEPALQPVQVSVRVRDYLWHERPALAVGGELPAPGVFAVGEQAVGVVGKGKVPTMVCSVDQALWSVKGGTNPYQGQAGVFEAVGAPLARAVLGGQDALLVACGPSGSGKTYSVFGLPGEGQGILPRLLHQLFDSGSAVSLDIEVLALYQNHTYCLITEAACWARKAGRASSVRRPTLELPAAERYNALQRLRAGRRAARVMRRMKLEAGAPAKMLSNPVKLLRNLQCGQDAAVGSQQISVDGPAAAVAAITAAAKRRPQAATPINAHSSRAHLLVNVTVHRMDGSRAQLQVADLAGGEKLGVHYQEPRRREGQIINSSLFSVKRAVAAIARGDRYVPKRDSLLTRMLALGSAHLEWLTTVAPALSSAGESRTALQEAEVAKGVAKVRVDAAILQREEARFARMVAERSKLQMRAVAACAAAGCAADRAVAARKETAERLAPSLAKAALALCCALHNGLWRDAVRRLKAAQRAGGDRWKHWYTAQLPKGRRHLLDPAAHPLHVLLTVLEAAPPPTECPSPRPQPGGCEGSDHDGERQRARERKAARARRAREKQRAARQEEDQEVRAAAEQAREQSEEAEEEEEEKEDKKKRRRRRKGKRAAESPA